MAVHLGVRAMDHHLVHRPFAGGGGATAAPPGAWPPGRRPGATGLRRIGGSARSAGSSEPPGRGGPLAELPGGRPGIGRPLSLTRGRSGGKSRLLGRVIPAFFAERDAEWPSGHPPPGTGPVGARPVPRARGPRGRGVRAGGVPPDTLAPKSDFARLLDQVFRRSFQLATIVFFLVEGALVYALFRFRGSAGAEPHQTTATRCQRRGPPSAPILVFIAIPTIRTIFKTAETPTDNPLVIEVIGHQWWWEFRYPEYNLVTAGDMHVPTGRTGGPPDDDAGRGAQLLDPAAGRQARRLPEARQRLWCPAAGSRHLRAVRGVLRHPARGWRSRWWRGRRRTSTGAPAWRVGGCPARLDRAQDSLVTAGRQLFAVKGCIGCHATTAVAK